MKGIRMMEIPELLKEYLENCTKKEEESSKLLRIYKHSYPTITPVIYAASMEEKLSLKEKEEFLQSWGFPPNSDVDLKDYLVFYQNFGNNPQLYLTLRPLKDEADVSWLQIKNIEWGDIDFKNKTIRFEKEEEIELEFGN